MKPNKVITFLLILGLFSFVMEGERKLLRHIRTTDYSIASIRISESVKYAWFFQQDTTSASLLAQQYDLEAPADNY